MVYKTFQTINDVSLKGKTVLLRVDINSEIVKGKPVLSGRMIAHAQTVKHLQKKGARVIILAHQSRPGKKDFTSLKEHAKLMNKYTKVSFIDKTVGESVAKKILSLNNGEALFLENVRMLDDEFVIAKKNAMVKFFVNLVDYYVNDAFSICHRNEASISLLPEFIPSLMGPVLHDELVHIDKVKNNISKSVFILGGNKVSDIQLLIHKNKILPTGVLSLVVLKACGYDVGNTEDKALQKEYAFLPLITKKKKLFVVPEDLAYIHKGKRKEVILEDLPFDSLALDIGKKTVDKYIAEIQKAKYIFWKGTAGDTSRDAFSYGTKKLLKAIEESPAFCVAAGGHSETAIRKYNINRKKLGYVSLSGGALVHYVAGKKLLGLEVLKKKHGTKKG